MYKKEKRAALFIALLMLLQSVCSCAGAGAENETGNDESEKNETTKSAEETANLPDIDMNGFEFKVFNYNDQSLYWADNRILVNEITGDIVDDAIYMRNLRIMDQFNCVIEEDTDNWVSSFHMRKLVQSGDPEYSVFMMYDSTVAESISLSEDWNKIPFIDTDKKWWFPEAQKAFNINGTQFALTGNYTLGAYSRAMCIVYNKYIYDRIGVDEDLYASARDGKWTLDKMVSIGETAVLDLNGDNRMDGEDRYGYFSNFKDYIANFSVSCGVRFVETDDSGNYVYTLDKNEKGITLIQRLAELWKNKRFMYEEGGSVHDVKPERFFETGHSLFRISSPNDLIEYRNSMNDDIGVLPMPKYDENQKSYISNSSGVAVGLLPKGYDENNAGNIGIILEAMSFYSYTDVINKYIDVAVTKKATRDTGSEEMMEIIFDSISFDFGLSMLIDKFASGFMTTIKKNPDAVLSAINADKNIIDADIEDIVAAVEDMSSDF